MEKDIQTAYKKAKSVPTNEKAFYVITWRKHLSGDALDDFKKIYKDKPNVTIESSGLVNIETQHEPSVADLNQMTKADFQTEEDFRAVEHARKEQLFLSHGRYRTLIWTPRP